MVSIATHDGTFHADDVFATMILRFVFPDFQLIRSRDKTILDNATIVYDVGGVFDHSKLRYDHHMRNALQRDNGVTYSSVGLIFKFYGIHAITNILSEKVPDTIVSDELILKIWSKIDESLILKLDEIDTGFKKPEPTDIAVMISKLNSSWNEDDDSYTNFNMAVSIAETFFIRIVMEQYNKSLVPDIVLKEYRNLKYEGILLLSKSIPYESTIFDHNLDDILFVIWQEKNGNWIVKTVPEEQGSFTPRVKFPDDWCGLADEELQKVSGRETAVFVHINGFIGAAKTQEDAVAMARQSISRNKLTTLILESKR